MILAATALGQTGLGGASGGLSANFIELSPGITCQLAIECSLDLQNAPIGISYYPPVIDSAENLLTAANNKRALTTIALSESGSTLTVDDALTWPVSGVVTLDYAMTAARTPTSSEIVYYTDRAGSVLSITNRAKGGTTAKAWPIGSAAEMRHTAEYHNLLAGCIVALQTELTSVEASLQGSIDAIQSDLTAVETGKISRSGDTMTGQLTLANPPSASLHAVNKAYVDSVQPTVWNAKSYGCVGDGVTDDTAAINALNTTVFNAGGGKIYFPRGVYLVGGPLLDPTGHNAQIPIPILSQFGSTVTMEWIGELAPPTTLSVQGDFSGDTYSIIKSTLTGGAGNASLLGGRQDWPPPTTYTNGVVFNLTDMLFKLPADPTFTALDFSNQLSNRITHVLVYAGIVHVQTVTEPTHSNAYGIKLPPTNHSSRVDVDAFNTFGIYTAVRSGELAYGTFIAQCGKVGLEVPFANFGTHFNLIGCYNVAIPIKATGDGECRLLINLLSIEDNNSHWPAWMDLIYAVDDPSNLLHGKCNYETQTTATVGASHQFPKNGGIYFIQTDVW